MFKKGKKRRSKSPNCKVVREEHNMYRGEVDATNILPRSSRTRSGKNLSTPQRVTPERKTPKRPLRRQAPKPKPPPETPNGAIHREERSLIDRVDALEKKVSLLEAAARPDTPQRNRQGSQRIESDAEDSDEFVNEGSHKRRRCLRKKQSQELQASHGRKADFVRQRQNRRGSSIHPELRIGRNPIVSDDDSDEDTTDDEYASEESREPLDLEPPPKRLRLAPELDPDNPSQRALVHHQRKGIESFELSHGRPPCFTSVNKDLVVNLPEPYQNRGRRKSGRPGWSWWYLISQVPPSFYKHAIFPRRRDDKVLCVGCNRNQPAAAHFDIDWEINQQSIRFCGWMGCCCAEKTQDALDKNIALATFFSTTDEQRRRAAMNVLQPEVEEVR